MSYIKELEIKNFGPIESAELRNLRNINIIIGPNNCGKTHILEAINFLGKLNDEPFAAEKYRRSRKHDIEIVYTVHDNTKLRLVSSGDIIKPSNGSSKNVRVLFHDTDDKELKKLSKDRESLEYISNIIKGLDYYSEGLEGRTYLEKISVVRRCGEDLDEWDFSEQGSGFKYGVPLLVSLKKLEEDYDILLIDEPELGLHPAAKIFLFELFKKLARKGKQIFIATHDPFFANPRLIDDTCSVYSYSFDSNKFINIDFSSIKHRYTFVGFFPHNTSMKDIHIYVEGPEDVYVFQAFLLTYLKKKKMSMIDFNRVAIFHLGGDNYSHFLYTVPKIPKSLIILDGNKKDDNKLKKVINKLNNIYDSPEDLATFPKFALCTEISQVEKELENGKCPIYFLKKNDIHEYFEEFSKKPNALEFAKKVLTVDDLPDEFKEIFDIIFGNKNLVFGGSDWYLDWKDVDGGKIEICEFQGKKCLKKTKNSDPAGAYKELFKKIERKDGKIIMEGFVYRPKSNDVSAVGDRIFLEDDEGNGYGVFVYHGNYAAIEMREKGMSKEILKYKEFKNEYKEFKNNLQGSWYKFKFIIDDTKIYLTIENNGKLLKLMAENETYSKFSRVAIRGGYEYYVSDLKVYLESRNLKKSK